MSSWPRMDFWQTMFPICLSKGTGWNPGHERTFHQFLVFPFPITSELPPSPQHLLFVQPLVTGGWRRVCWNAALCVYNKLILMHIPLAFGLTVQRSAASSLFTSLAGFNQLKEPARWKEAMDEPLVLNKLRVCSCDQEENIIRRHVPFPIGKKSVDLPLSREEMETIGKQESQHVRKEDVVQMTSTRPPSEIWGGSANHGRGV